MLAAVHGKRDTLRTFIDLLVNAGWCDDSRRETTRALLVEGAQGVGKSHTLGIALRSARERGYHTVGPVDGRDISGDLTSLYPGGAGQPPEPLAGYPLPPDDGVPLVVGVDDAHLADPARLRLDMRWLARNRRTGGVWMLTTRTAGWSTAIAADEVVHASLGDLPDSGMVALVTDVLGAPPDPALMAFVAQTGGNPRLVTDLVTGLREEGALCQRDGRTTLVQRRIPQRVVAGVRYRLEALSPRCRQMVQVAAALNGQFCLVSMAELLDEPIAHLLPLLDEASEAGLVTSDGAKPEFRNAVLCQAIRASLPTDLRAALHHQATARPAAGPPPRQESVFAGLGDKERSIAQLAAKGLTNQQIARRVFLSPHTVNYHMRHIFRKLAVTSRIELARLVAEASPRAS